MSFTFLPAEMSDDLIALSRAASTLFSKQSVSRIERLAQDLTIGVANAKATGQTSFNWRTTQPIQICESRQYKGSTADFDPLSADITVDFKCETVLNSPRLHAQGVTVMRIKDAAKSEEKVLHFDADKGGWIEASNGKERAGHPPFHMQFYGMVNDIPRIPSLIVHPVDVLTWAILELHQKKWRDLVTSTIGKSKLRKIPGRQRNRFGLILDEWRQTVTRPDHLAVVAMQSAVSRPLAL